MHLSMVSPIPPPTWGIWVSGGDLSNQICTITQIWSIAYLTNPLQYPMFSPPTTLGTSEPLCLCCFVAVPLCPMANCIKAVTYIKEQCPTHGAPKSEQIPYQPPGIPQVGEWGSPLIARCMHNSYPALIDIISVVTRPYAIP